jgi:hypothetical protein
VTKLPFFTSCSCDHDTPSCHYFINCSVLLHQLFSVCSHTSNTGLYLHAGNLTIRRSGCPCVNIYEWLWVGQNRNFVYRKTHVTMQYVWLLEKLMFLSLVQAWIIKTLDWKLIIMHDAFSMASQQLNCWKFSLTSLLTWSKIIIPRLAIILQKILVNNRYSILYDEISKYCW